MSKRGSPAKVLCDQHFERVKCAWCAGTGFLRGVREVAGRCGTRRGTTLRRCCPCDGDGYIALRVRKET